MRGTRDAINNGAASRGEEAWKMLGDFLPAALQRSARLSEEAAAPPLLPQPLVAQADAAREAVNGTSEPALANPLVWLDLEMTGLDLDSDTVIEVACIITDGELEHVIEGPDVAIHHDEAVLSTMNEWSTTQHGASGLTQRCRESTISMRDAEDQVLAFVGAHTEAGAAQLAGNSVHVDAAFLRRWMPRLSAHLHYRIVDVSTVMELCRRWYPRAYRRAPRKKALHTAKSDIYESLDQLRFYRQAIFKRPP
ncbi:hypothetical protein WJX81_007867 [Elliptochloris bilobata]|uniref:Exonuclease domain-containing protein n=1 Tax=Elliptochloris bilobata TaxID=381761 RepID=A0AAW1RZN9_9CHLO